MRPLGLRLRVHPGFVALMGLMVAIGQGGRATMLFAAVLLHEAGHVVAARLRGIPIRDVVLMPFGGVAYLDEAELAEPAVESRVALGGPLASLALGAILLAGAWVVETAGAAPGGARPVVEAGVAWLRRWAGDHLGLGLFNLLPVFPLDGGRLVRAALARRLGFRQATGLVGRLGELAGAVMTGAALLSYGLSGRGASAVVMGLFLLYAARMERRRAPGTWVRHLARRLEPGTGGAVPIHEGRVLVAPEQTPVKEVALRLLPGRWHLVVLTGPGGRMVGLTGEREVVEALIERGIATPLSRVPHRKV
ncbi:M50 family metallopeptidase [Geochorda subterranea]|uniref:M50 family metallopeptidase n=1 Tax=Geochorda subterranea TaxID=3109564 RepID=A0ABZ1BLK6_9FIRM|nr:M50 family metallopeptidase [Limnochorda sp. LNt]WRP13574.1 M50 family metallopeptidase [Limnochorda sp. LNt]